jgi:hypothetical protein
MKIRIAIWASAGALVVIFWTLYFSTTRTSPLAMTGFLLALANLTCPIALLRHRALSFEVVFLGNAATYALIGAVIEAIQGHSHTLSISN